MYDGFPGYAVKSAGTEDHARVRVSAEDIQWADMIFVMETGHLQKLHAQFGDLLSNKNVVCLEIPDIYHCMEPALIDELKAKLEEHVAVPE